MNSHEQRILDEIERALSAEDPKLAGKLTQIGETVGPFRRHWRRNRWPYLIGGGGAIASTLLAVGLHIVSPDAGTNAPRVPQAPAGITLYENRTSAPTTTLNISPSAPGPVPLG